MANRNDHSDDKNAKTATTRQQDQERGQDAKTAQSTRDKGNVPVKDNAGGQSGENE